MVNLMAGLAGLAVGSRGDASRRPLAAQFWERGARPMFCISGPTILQQLHEEPGFKVFNVEAPFVSD